MRRKDFVSTLIELRDSVLEFNKATPEMKRNALGSNSLYFVHVRKNKKDYFGLSKFCAFKGISVEQYRSEKYYETTDGGETRDYILRLTGIDWEPRAEAREELRNAFDLWISSFHKTYKLEKASFISLENLVRPVKPSKAIGQRNISPEELSEKLVHQEKIGKAGEAIALKYEADELRKRGVPNAKKYLIHEARKNSAAGYDILNNHPERERYIEVKASTSKNGDFFITENEVKTLENYGDSSFIYLVHVIDLDKETGRVHKTIQNPIKILKELDCMQPVAYRISPKNL